MVIAANFSTSTDEDWILAELSAGVTYRILLEPGSPVDLLSFNAFSLEDGTGPFSGLAGSMISGRGESSADNPDGSKQIVFTPSFDSTYYLQAMQFGSQTEPISYAISVEEIIDDYPDNSSTTGFLPIGGQVDGSIEVRDDADWFRTQLSAGVTYEFIVTSASGSAPLLDAYSADDMGDFLGEQGRVESGTFNFGDNRQSMTFTPLVDSTYYVNVGSEHQGVDAYTVTLNAIPDDYADNINTSGFVTTNGILNGNIEVEDDADLIRMNLDPGMTYQIEVTSNGLLPLSAQIFSNEDGTGLDSLGENYRFDIGTGDFDDPTSTITFSSLEGGTYYFKVEKSSFFSGDFLPTSYSVSLKTVNDDFFDTIETTGVVSIGQDASGNIEVIDDNDWFKAELLGGVTYVARVTPEGSSGLSQEEIFARQLEIAEEFAAGGLSQSEINALLDELNDLNEMLVGGDFSATRPFSVQAASEEDLNQLFDVQNRVESVSTGPFDDNYSQLVFTPRQGGTYYFDVYHDLGRTGAYTLELETVLDDFSDNVDTTGFVAAGGEASGRIDVFGDTDWFKTELQPGVTYLVRLEHEQLDSFFPSSLLLSVASNDDSDGLIDLAGTVEDGFMFRSEYGFFNSENVSHVVFTPLEGGTYFVQVDGLTSEPVDYSVSIQTIADDFPDNTHTLGSVGPSDGTPSNDPPPDDRTLVEKLALLYEAALDRRPDNPGLNYFISKIREGQSLHDIANSFYIAEEFRDQFDSFDDDAYINQLYLNVLDRPADQPGFDYWSEQRANGLTHTDILISFTESAENFENASDWLAGLSYEPLSDLWLL
jgi:hypothetical protein